MSEATNLFQFDAAPVGLLDLMGIGVFAVAYYFLFRRRDFRTSIELAIIAWLIASLKATTVINGCYQILLRSNHPIQLPWYVVDIIRFIGVTKILLIPAFLTCPIVWACLRSRFFRWPREKALDVDFARDRVFGLMPHLGGIRSAVVLLFYESPLTIHSEK